MRRLGPQRSGSAPRPDSAKRVPPVVRRGAFAATAHSVSMRTASWTGLVGGLTVPGPEVVRLTCWQAAAFAAGKRLTMSVSAMSPSTAASRTVRAIDRSPPCSGRAGPRAWRRRRRRRGPGRVRRRRGRRLPPDLPGLLVCVSVLFRGGREIERERDQTLDRRPEGEGIVALDCCVGRRARTSPGSACASARRSRSALAMSTSSTAD